MSQQNKTAFQASIDALLADNTSELITELVMRTMMGNIKDSVPFLNTLNAYTAQQRWAKGADVASATALDIGTDGNYFDVTGTTTVTSITDMGGAGAVIILQFDAALTFTHHATDLILPGGANITTAAGDHAIMVNYASGDWRCVGYFKASGEATVLQDLSGKQDILAEGAFVDGDKTKLDGLNNTSILSDWTARSAAEANSWKSVTYGNGLYVAIAYSGTNRVMTSPDGITWTARSAAEANTWSVVTYGNGLFVAVSNDGTNRVMTSPDGTTWTARSAAEANQWQSVTYANGLFVAVAGSGTNKVMTSPDGTTWTARSAEDSVWKSVTYGNGLYVAVAYSGTNQVMTSPDGTTWTARSASEANQWQSVTYGNGLYVAVSQDGTNRVMTSPDGTTWTARSVSAYGWRDVTYGNGLFVAVSAAGIMTSPDGTTWTAQDLAEAGSWAGVTYGNGLFVSVAYTGTNRVMTTSFASLFPQYLEKEATVYDTQDFSVGAMIPSITNGAEAGTRELATNDVMIDYLAFDKDTDEYAQWNWVLPEQVTSDPAIRFKFKWTAAAGSGTVLWGIQHRVTSNDDAIDGSWGTASTATADTLLATDDDHLTDGACTVTLTGYTAGDTVWFRVFRDVSGDTLSDDAQLLRVLVQYPRNNTASTVWS